MLHRLFVASLALTLASCGGGVNAPKLTSLPDGVPREITVAGVRLTLETELWRDFMPIAPPDGRPLAAVLRVRSVTGSPLPTGLTMTQATVFYEGNAWDSVPEPLPGFDPAVLTAHVSGGPKWGPGVTVDVVVALKLEGEQRLLGATDQWIQRTD